MLRIGIAGATGYTGRECIRLLQHHPQVQITHLFSTTLAGQETSALCSDTSMLPDHFESFDETVDYPIDCLFLAVPHGTSHKNMAAVYQRPYKVVDLSADFRLSDPALFSRYYGQEHQSSPLLEAFPYGIPELYGKEIAEAKGVANPGCYATAAILALMPLKSELQSAVIDAKSGVSGAGKSLKESLLYCEVNEHVSAYATNQHRHQAELQEQIACDNLIFSPHLIPMSRGILLSCYLTLSKQSSFDELVSLYSDFYAEAPFVKINSSERTATTQRVVGSNICEITIASVSETQVILFAAEDNLIKGAAGQAIQNMNLMFGLDQALGLPRISLEI